MLKRKLLILLLLPMLMISPALLIKAGADPGSVHFTLEGLTLGPPYGYTTGLVRGYAECQWIPFNLTIHNMKTTSINLNVEVDLDYNITQGARTGAVGIDGFGIDSTLANRWMIRRVNVATGTTVDLGPYTPTVVHFASKDTLRFSFSLTVPQNTMFWILWQNHLSSTGSPNLFNPTDTIETGASFWPGGRLHVQASLSGDVNGLRSVPIQRPPMPEIPGEASISGVKFHDRNANGTREVGEEGLEDWTIELYKNVSNVWVFVDDTLTGAAGDYIFSVTEAGEYTVKEVLKTGWIQTAPALGNYTLDVVLGQVYSYLDFGNVQLGSISVAKFYDANVNGTWDVGEPPIEGWKIHLTGTNIQGDTIDEYAFTNSSGKHTFEDLLPGDYTVTEIFPLVPPNPRYINTTMTSFEVELEEGENYIGPDFGNVCLGPGGGRTLGYWSNKNGRNTMINTIGMETALLALRNLNLVYGNGNPFNPTTYDQFRSWLLDARATNMAYMLSAQLAAMKLNVMAGFVDGTRFVYAPGVPGSNPAGFISVNDLMTAANNELGANSNTPAGSPYRAVQEAIKDALDDANNNLNFVCPGPCPFIYP